MHRFTRQIAVREPFQLLALSDRPDDWLHPTDGYAIATRDGALLRRDLTLEEARRWLDRLFDEQPAHAPAGPAARPRR